MTVTGARSRLADRSWSRGALTVLAGIVVMVGTLLATARRLDYDIVARQGTGSIGVVPPLDARPGRGMAVGIDVVVTACDRPASITVVVSGTAEYWLDKRRKLHRSSVLRLLLPGVGSGNVTLESGHSPSDVLAVPPRTVRPAMTTQPRMIGRRAIRRGDPDGGDTAISVRVRDWGRTLAPVIARYETSDWIKPRGPGSCYLRLPSVTSDLSIIAAQQAAGRARPLGQTRYLRPTESLLTFPRLRLEAVYRPGVATQVGFTAVHVRHGAISTGESTPAPDSSIDGAATWTCTSRPRRTAPIGAASKNDPPEFLSGASRSMRGALSGRALTDTLAPDCSAIAVVVESASARNRDLTLIFAGTIFGLGVALLTAGLGQLLTLWRTATRADGSPEPQRAAAQNRHHADTTEQPAGGHLDQPVEPRLPTTENRPPATVADNEARAQTAATPVLYPSAARDRAPNATVSRSTAAPPAMHTFPVDTENAEPTADSSPSEPSEASHEGEPH